MGQVKAGFHFFIELARQKFVGGNQKGRQTRSRENRRRPGLLSAVAFIACLTLSSLSQAEVASIYGGSDGLCGSRTANGERSSSPYPALRHERDGLPPRVRGCSDQ
jgi:hypothetical protein